jgi:anaerobic magnesium-protoporphyrin IX monomethyl ester cyclase
VTSAAKDAGSGNSIEVIEGSDGRQHKKGIRVLLVYANSPMDNLIPIGISVLSACLKQTGHKIKLFDTTFYRTRPVTGDDVRSATLQVLPVDLSKFGIKFKRTNLIDDFKNTVNDYDPQLIGISYVESTLDIALSLLEAVADKRIPKILGGISAHFHGHDLINHPHVDIVCVGEGEGAIVELANAIRDKKDYSHIKNLLVKTESGIIKNELRPLVDLNRLPFQDWSIYDRTRFYKPMGGRARITGAFEVARGCPRSCTFCCNYGINRIYKGSYFRTKSIDRLIAELTYAQAAYGIEYVYFYAENFLLSLGKNQFDRFIAAYAKIRIPFWIETEPESLTPYRLTQLKKIGCQAVSVGVEHGNEKFRREMLNRRISNEKLIGAFQTAKAVGVNISANNIIGFPTETRELIFETIGLNRKLNPDNIIVNLFNPYQGTPLRDLAVQAGYLDSGAVGQDYRSTTVLDQPQLTAAQLLGLQRTFVLYVKLPQSKWPLLKRAEQLDPDGDRIYEQLVTDYMDDKSRDSGKVMTH